MRSYKIHFNDAFTDCLFQGNPTVTVLNADPLSDREMGNIAQEVNLSESGFLLESSIADFKLRYFTRTKDEVKFCGHATLGALSAIAKEGLYGYDNGKKIFQAETNAGILSMFIKEQDGQIQYGYDLPSIDLVPAPHLFSELLDSLGDLRHLLDQNYPFMLEKTQQYLYFIAKDLKHLEQFNPDMERLTAFAKKYGIIIFCVATKETFDSNNHLHARGFAPLVGVPEDPFTGSMQGGLAAYAMQHHILPSSLKSLTVEQGHIMKRPGQACLEISSLNPPQVRLMAKTAHFFTAEIKL